VIQDASSALAYAGAANAGAAGAGTAGAGAADAGAAAPATEEILTVRAYGYYLGGNYERAIRDCQRIIGPNPYDENNDVEVATPVNAFAHEVRGRINFNMNRYVEAVGDFARVLNFRCVPPEDPQPQPQPPQWSQASPALLDWYRDACKKLENK